MCSSDLDKPLLGSAVDNRLMRPPAKLITVYSIELIIAKRPLERAFRCEIASCCELSYSAGLGSFVVCFGLLGRFWQRRYGSFFESAASFL